MAKTAEELRDYRRQYYANRRKIDPTFREAQLQRERLWYERNAERIRQKKLAQYHARGEEGLAADRARHARSLESFGAQARFAVHRLGRFGSRAGFRDLLTIQDDLAIDAYQDWFDSLDVEGYHEAY